MIETDVALPLPQGGDHGDSMEDPHGWSQDLYDLCKLYMRPYVHNNFSVKMCILCRIPESVELINTAKLTNVFRVVLALLQSAAGTALITSHSCYFGP